MLVEHKMSDDNILGAHLTLLLHICVLYEGEGVEVTRANKMNMQRAKVASKMNSTQQLSV